MHDPGNYVLSVKINGVIEMVALVDTRASQAKAMGEVKNTRIQIGYQAYVVDLLILDISVDPELPLLLGRPFLRTCRAVINMGRCTLCIDDGVIRHTYFPKQRTKSYVKSFEMEGEDDWLGSFEVGRDEDGNVKYDPVAPSFINIEDDMERALAMEAYFIPFKNGDEGYGSYKKVEGDEIGTLGLKLLRLVGSKLGDFDSLRIRLIGFRIKEASRERFQNRDLWMMSAIKELRGVNLAWIIADHLYKHALGTKETSVICVGHYVTRIASFLGYYVDDEIKNYSEPTDCNFAYPTYKPPNVPPCPYPYIPYPYPHTHYPNPGNQSNQEGCQGLGGDDYFTSAMPDFGGSSSGYAVGGSSKDAGFNDDDMAE
nr:hypothetical protein [Tanacetum cinerariifolium]